MNGRRGPLLFVTIFTTTIIANNRNRAKINKVITLFVVYKVFVNLYMNKELILKNLYIIGVKHIINIAIVGNII